MSPSFRVGAGGLHPLRLPRNVRTAPPEHPRAALLATAGHPGRPQLAPPARASEEVDQAGSDAERLDRHRRKALSTRWSRALPRTPRKGYRISSVPCYRMERLGITDELEAKSGRRLSRRFHGCSRLRVFRDTLREGCARRSRTTRKAPDGHRALVIHAISLHRASVGTGWRPFSDRPRPAENPYSPIAGLLRISALLRASRRLSHAVSSPVRRRPARRRSWAGVRAARLSMAPSRRRRRMCFEPAQYETVARSPRALAQLSDADIVGQWTSRRGVKQTTGHTSNGRGTPLLRTPRAFCGGNCVQTRYFYCAEDCVPKGALHFAPYPGLDHHIVLSKLSTRGRRGQEPGSKARKAKR